MQRQANGSLNPFKHPRQVRVVTDVPINSDDSFDNDYPEEDGERSEYDDEDLDDAAFDDRIGEIIEDRIENAMLEVISELKDEVKKLAPQIIKAEIAAWFSGGKYLIDQCAKCGEEHPGKECTAIEIHKSFSCTPWGCP